jgi:hypothetical protein
VSRRSQSPVASKHNSSSPSRSVSSAHSPVPDRPNGSPSSSRSLPIGRTPPPGRIPSRSPVPSASLSPGWRSYKRTHRRPFDPSVSPRQRSFSPGYGRRQGASSTTLFVGSLPQETTQADVREFFEQYGPVMNVKLIYNHDTDEFKGFGFVTFQHPLDAEDAAEDAQGKEILGSRIRCNPARDSRAPRGPPRDFRYLLCVSLTLCLYGPLVCAGKPIHIRE